MSILFLRAANQEGNTAALAEVLLSGKEYETLNLIDYRIGSYEQNSPDDQLYIVIEKIKQLEVKFNNIFRVGKRYGRRRGRFLVWQRKSGRKRRMK